MAKKAVWVLFGIFTVQPWLLIFAIGHLNSMANEYIIVTCSKDFHSSSHKE